MKKTWISFFSIFIILISFPALGLAFNLSSGNVSGSPGQAVVVPINISDVGSGLNIEAFSFTINFNPSVLVFDEAAFDTAGTLVDNFDLVGAKEVADNPGAVKVNGASFSGPITVSANGIFVNLNFIVQDTFKNSSLSLTDFLNDFNGAETTDAVFSITGVTTTVVVTPASTTGVVAGESVPMTAQVLINGSQYDVTDPADVSFATSGNGTFDNKTIVDGKIQADYKTSTTVESATITATEQVTGGENDGTATVASIAGLADAAASTVAASPTSGIVVSNDGSSFSTVTVTVKDANENPASGRTVKITLSGEDNFINGVEYSDPVNLSAATAANGQVSFQLSSTKVGTKTIAAEVDGVSITQEAEVAFVAGGVSPANSTVTSDPESVTTDGGAKATIAITLMDTFDNPVSGQAVTLEATGTDNTIEQPAGVTDVEGQISGTIASTKAETKTVTAKVGAVTVGTVDVEFTPGDVSQFTIETDKPKLASEGRGTATITATVKDQNENIVTSDNGRNFTFSITVNGTYLKIDETQPIPTSNGQAVTTVTTQGGPVSGETIATVQAMSAGLTTQTVDIEIVNFSVEADFLSLVTSGEPNQATLTAVGATNYVWTIEDGTGSLSAGSAATATFTAPATIAEGSPFETTVIRVADASDANVYAEVSIKTYEPVAVENKPEEPPVVLPGEDSEAFTVAGGDGIEYTWSVVGPDEYSYGDTGESFTFTAPDEGAFAGEYTITVEDGNLFSDSFTVLVPLTFDPEYFTLVENDFLDIVISGAAEGTAFTVTPYDLDGNAVAFSEEGETPTGYGQMEFVGNILQYTPDDIDAITEFTLMIVADDPDLADLGLATLDSGIYRVIPLAFYSGTIVESVDSETVPVAGALIEVIAPEIGGDNGITVLQMPIYQDLTDEDGAFELELPATGANYQFMVSKDGYVSKVFSAADLAENSTINISQVGGEALYIRGVVSPSDSEAIVSLYVDGELFGIRTTDEGDFRFDFETDPGDVELLLTASSENAYGELIVTSIPTDGADIDLTEGADSAIQLTIVGDIENEESDYTYGADFLVEITAEDSTGAPVSEFPNGLVLTLPFNLGQVAPGAFEAGDITIYHAATRDELLAGDGEAVQVEDILAVDYLGDGQVGYVTFRVYSLSVFGIGVGADTGGGGGGGGGGGCFIGSAAANSGMVLPFAGMALAGIGLALGRIVRRRFDR